MRNNTELPPTSLIRWQFVRGTHILTCAVDVDRSQKPASFEVSTVPHWDISRAAVEALWAGNVHLLWRDAERLRHEHNISAASTWNDRETAERAVGVALQQNRDKIDRWLNRSGGHPNLVIDYDGDASHPIGRSLARGADEPQPCAHATVVLKWTGPNEYYVLTSYPECR